MDVSEDIAAKSDQMNAIDLAADITVTILDAKKGSDKRWQLITDVYGPTRPFKPSKTVLRDIVQAWGLDSDVWVGRRLTLFNDRDVLWAGEKVGGIRVRAMSHITEAFEATHAISRTAKKKVMIRPLPNAAPTRDWQSELALAGDDIDAVSALGTAAKNANAPADVLDVIRAKYTALKAAS